MIKQRPPRSDPEHGLRVADEAKHLGSQLKKVIQQGPDAAAEDKECVVWGIGKAMITHIKRGPPQSPKFRLRLANSVEN